LDDTEEILISRVLVAEHKAYPAALELIASGKVYRGEGGKVVWK